MTGMTITKDLFKQVAESIGTMAKRRVLIGIPAPENQRQDGALGNAALGYIHEKGSGVQKIPARPFLVPGVRAAEAKTIKALKAAAQAALDGDPHALDQGLNTAGLIGQTTVKQTLRNGGTEDKPFKPLSQRTLAARRRKGFAGEKPLVRTAQLLNSITYVVRDK